MNPDTDKQIFLIFLNIWRNFLFLLRISRPPLWIALPLVFLMGLAYAQHGLTDSSFHFTPLIILQLFLLSFPICLYTFGLNDIYDHESDRINPRKNGIEGVRLETQHHKMVRTAAFSAGFLFLSTAAATQNPANIFFAVTILCLSCVYSVPPWRLKVRPPLDVISAGILGFLAPFAMGYSFADDATAIPFQAYYFTFCVMGFHAFSTIMDHDVDKQLGDRTFAVAYGKRAAALFPAVVFLYSLFIVNIIYIKGFFMLCLLMCLFVAINPSEKIARYSFLLMFLGAAAVLGVWIASLVF
jgi:4-hydroxybenzoate polyprenyltransferase